MVFKSLFCTLFYQSAHKTHPSPTVIGPVCSVPVEMALNGRAARLIYTSVIELTITASGYQSASIPVSNVSPAETADVCLEPSQATGQ